MSPAEHARRQRFGHFMDTYYMARHAWLMACEAATACYAAEVTAYRQENPPMVFKRYLVESRGMPR